MPGTDLQVDLGFLPSHDADAAIYHVGRPSRLVIRMQIHGSRQGRERNGRSGILVTGSALDTDALWAKVKVGREEGEDVYKNLSHWRFEEKILVATLIGHDYDSSRTGASNRPAGLKGFGLVSALRAAEEARAKFGDLSGFDYFEQALGDQAAGNSTDRLLAVCLGFYCHPCVSVEKGAVVGAGLFGGECLTPCTTTWLAKNDPLFYQQLANFDTNEALLKNAANYDHCGCTGCGDMGVAALRGAVDADDDGGPDVQNYVPGLGDGGFQSVTEESLPQMTEKVMTTWLETHGTTSAQKRKEEGLARAFDSSAYVREAGIVVQRESNPPTCCLRMAISQSQGRGVYHPSIHMELSADCLSAVRITKSSCDCHNKDCRWTCKHRCAAVAYLWVNTVIGKCGNPTAMLRYWDSHLPGGALGCESAVRTATIATDRSAQPSITELEMHEQRHASAGAGAVESESSSEDIQVEVKRAKVSWGEEVAFYKQEYAKTRETRPRELLSLQRRLGMHTLVRQADIPGGFEV